MLMYYVAKPALRTTGCLIFENISMFLDIMDFYENLSHLNQNSTQTLLVENKYY